MVALTGCANDPPSASFTINPNPTQGQAVTFDASASKPSHDANDVEVGPITRFEWDLDGDGDYETSTSAAQVTHRYSGTQNVRITLRITDSAGRQAAAAYSLATTEKETALVAASDCGGVPADYACGADPIASPLSSTAETPATVSQPNYAQAPIFDAMFGSFTSDSPDERVAITNGSGRVYVLHPSGTSDVVSGYDADTRAALFDKPVTTRGRARDVAFYRDGVYVMLDNGDVLVLDRDGAMQRAVRAPLAAAFGASTIDYSNLTVAWNELWTTASLGEKTGSALVVRDATTGAMKHAYVHTADVTCRYGESGRVCSGQNPESGILMKDPEPPHGEAFTAGISAVPELGALVTQCRPILRVNDFGATLSHDEKILADAGPCANAEFKDALMGTDAAWGQRHFIQMRKHAVGTADEPSLITSVDDYEVQPNGAPNAWGTQPVALVFRRSWEPQDSWTRGYQDVSFQTRETQIDWWGPLTKEPSDWLRSPPNQCANFLVSDGDYFIAGQRGEHWWSPAPVTSVELWVGDANGSNYQRAATTTSASGQLCVDTRNYSNGEHDVGLRVALQNGTVLWRYAHLRKFDNVAPTGRLVEPEDYAHGTVTFAGLASDANPSGAPSSGIAGWQLEARPEASSTWRRVCGPDSATDANGRYDCDWSSADGSWPDGDYRVRAAMWDNASGGGNLGYTPEVSVTVDNTTWDDVDGGPDPNSTNDPPETDSEPALPDPNPMDNEDGVGDPESPQAECLESDPYIVTADPNYVDLEIGLPVGAPSSALALVDLLAIPQAPPIPVSMFQKEVETADFALYTASEAGAVRAVAELIKAPDGSWIGNHVEACSQFPSQTAPVTNAIDSTVP